MTSVRRDRWVVALGVLAGVAVIAAGLGLDTPWLVWLGVALALVALCLWPLLGARRDKEDPQADPSLTRPFTPRAAGGDAAAEDVDQHSTTGPSRNDRFVGRVSGADTGSEETSGAERRSWDGGQEPRS